jgi:putative ABC transport system permease protein
MNIAEIIRLAFKAIRANKLRSGLTALGIIIGVASIIILISIGSGLSQFVTNRFENFGTNTLFVAPGKFQFGGGGPPQRINKLTFNVVRSVERSKGRFISDVSSYIQIFVTVSYRDRSQITQLSGANNNYFKVFGFSVEKGRIYTLQEDKSARKVAVIGKTVAKKLFPNQNPLGKRILISKKPFTVIGVLSSQGNVVGQDIDNIVIIPLQSARVLTGADQVNIILVKTTSAQVMPQAKKQIERILLRTLSEDDFTILTQEQLLDSILQILSVLTVMLGGIAAISLVVGGVGISNIMLVSVTERTREIGLRKAVGARPRDILLQFLFEAVILSALGGFIGVLIGYLGSFIISSYLKTAVPLWAVVLGLGFSTAVGIVFGVVPAIRASRLQPIEALRHE